MNNNEIFDELICHCLPFDAVCFCYLILFSAEIRNRHGFFVITLKTIKFHHCISSNANWMRLERI